jgi:hypothetical protein
MIEDDTCLAVAWWASIYATHASPYTPLPLRLRRCSQFARPDPGPDA